MLNHFPTPFPGEWWYSVLCRYYLSSGIKESAIVKEELFGNRTAMMAPLFPNGTLYCVIKQLPEDAFDFDEILNNHTLYRYYMRFYPKAEQEYMHRSLAVGGSPKLTHMRVNYGRENFAPRYCPLCMKEDAKKYGQAYYHVNHQIPMVSVCGKHGVKLKQISLEKITSYVFSFRPLSRENVDTECEEGLKGEKLAAGIADDFLIKPLSIGPTEGYNNLVTQLINSGYYGFDEVAGLSVDSKNVVDSLKEMYGVVLFNIVFGENVGRNMMLRIRRFNQIMPDRYILLMGLVGMGFDEFLADGPIENIMLKKLCYVREKNEYMTVIDAANEMKLQTYELRALCKYYNIEPFWKELDSHVRSSVIKKRISCMVTEEEYEKLQYVAREHGYRGPGEYLVQLAIKNRYT